MRIVIDTNIIIRMLIKPDGIVASLFFQLKNKEDVYFSSASLEEISEHKKRILNTAKLKETELDMLLTNVVSHISILPLDIIPTSFFISAYSYLEDVDMDDIPFLASAMFLDGYLWTSDKSLSKKLSNKGFKHTLNNQDIAKLIVN